MVPFPHCLVPEGSALVSQVGLLVHPENSPFIGPLFFISNDENIHFNFLKKCKELINSETIFNQNFSSKKSGLKQ